MGWTTTRRAREVAATAESDLLLAARDLSLHYGGASVLRGVQLEVSAGQFWFLLGANGEGKSTLLRAITGSLRPQGGSLTLHASLRDRARIGFVPQRCELNPILPTTVREFVGLGLVGVRVDRAARAARLARALAAAGLDGLAARSYWALSGGERQRALVARALIREPRLLILDEPTNNLDLFIERAILDTVARLQRRERTAVLFVTHSLHLAERYATHVALFRGGAVRSGPAAALLRDEHLADLYGPPPAGGDGTAP